MEIFRDQESLLVDSPSQGGDLSVEVVDGRTSIIRMAVAGMAIGLVAAACNEQRVYFDELGSGEEDTLSIDDLDAGDVDTGQDVEIDAGDVDTGQDVEIDAGDVEIDAGEPESICTVRYVGVGADGIHRVADNVEMLHIDTNTDREGTLDIDLSVQLGAPFPRANTILRMTSFTDAMTVSIQNEVTGAVTVCMPPVYDAEGRHDFEDGVDYSTGLVSCEDISMVRGLNELTVLMSLNYGAEAGLSDSHVSFVIENEEVSFVDRDGSSFCDALDTEDAVIATFPRWIDGGGMIEMQGFDPSAISRIPLSSDGAVGNLVGNYSYEVFGDMIGIYYIEGHVEGRVVDHPLNITDYVEGVYTNGFVNGYLNEEGVFRLDEDNELFPYSVHMPGSGISQYYLAFEPGSKQEGQEYRLCVDRINAYSHSSSFAVEGEHCTPWVPVEDTSWSFPGFPK